MLAQDEQRSRNREVSGSKPKRCARAFVKALILITKSLYKRKTSEELYLGVSPDSVTLSPTSANSLQFSVIPGIL